jgi:hypothetical protein
MYSASCKTLIKLLLVTSTYSVKPSSPLFHGIGTHSFLSLNILLVYRVHSALVVSRLSFYSHALDNFVFVQLFYFVLTVSSFVGGGGDISVCITTGYGAG